MIKLIKRFGRPMLPLFMLALVLLVVRAGSELSLPNLMSDIVDYGIAQGGIDYVVPTALTDDTFNRLQELGWFDLTDIYTEDLRLDPLAVIDATLEESIMAALAHITDPNFERAMARPLAISAIRAEYEALGLDVAAMQLSYVYRTGLTMLLITLLGISAAISVGYLSSKIAAYIAKDIREAVFKKVIAFSSAEYNSFSTATLITRVTNDIQQVQTLLAMSIRLIGFSPIMAAGGVIMVVTTDINMAWIVSAAIAAIIGFVVLFIVISTPRFRIIQQLIDKINLVTRESLNGVMVIRAFTTQKYEAKKFDTVNTELKNNAIFLALLGALQWPVITLVMNFATIAIVYIGAASIQGGELRAGEMMAFIQYTIFIVMAFLMIAMIITMIPRAQVAAKRILEVLDMPLAITDPKSPETLTDIRGEVEFKDVSFTYPNAETPALQNINFTAEAGQTTAIIGATGAGKSSLAALVPRLYDVSGGAVLLDGVDVRKLKQADLRECLGYIPQKALLFSGTIESNIKYAGNIDDKQMEKAAAISQAAGFISEKEQGYNEEIAQGGLNVSGGQRQRLAIARAIAKNPQIYIFDDSFSALDFKTDARLRAAISEEISGATVIIIAQRIGTIKQADKIVVLDEGKVVGIGKHRELLTSCEVYKQIAQSQLSQEELL